MDPTFRGKVPRHPRGTTLVEKFCCGCQAVKPIEEFGIARREASGRQTYCRACRARQKREYRKQHRAKTLEIGARYREQNRELLRHRSKEYYAANKDHIQQLRVAKRDQKRDYALRRKFGISLEEYRVLGNLQDWKCAGCGQHESTFIRGLAVDHNHATGEVRGPLCYGCNAALGLLRESADSLRNLATYIEVYQVKQICEQSDVA